MDLRSDLPLSKTKGCRWGRQGMMGIVGRERLVVGGDREAGAGALLPREERKPIAAVPSVPSRSISSLPGYPQW